MKVETESVNEATSSAEYIELIAASERALRRQVKGVDEPWCAKQSSAELTE